ncbi:Helicase domino [Geodia barretti]|nr:Helicase domino [Geodia barretti]
MTGVRPEDGGSGSLALSKALLSYHTRAHMMGDTIRRFTIAVPPTTAPQISLHCHHPPPSHALREMELADAISRHLSPASSLLHTAATAASLQFPETRLIQYDCGKLQMLDSLLQQLKMGAHRVLIFTQMARMLDVLEIFLNYHGHTYLRLDGSTPPLKRQFLMDRFNRDKKIFCFILSTRSGGLGVNLTGADTVVFYDSDWNPTMDAQAQDRCHRIGQTRDVHIYRLVSERTVEENILKKANQKKLLGDIAIEGGAFTTDFFRKASLRELFKVQREEGRGGRVAMETPTQEESVQLSQKQIEEMLADVEDDTDVQAARMARAEETAEMAEFDETFSSQSTTTAGAAPSKEGKTASTAGVESQVQSEFDRLQEELSGVEQYAVRYLESERAHITSQELRLAEENIKLAKKDWELTHLQSLRAEEERLAEEEAEDVLLTYDRPETANKMIVDRETGDEMPMWLPPTPPAEEEDVIYVDPILSLTYHLSSTISPAVLAANVPFHVDDYDVFGLWRPPPPVVEPVKKSHQKSSSKKIKENVNVPPSLFWRRMAADSLPTKLRKLTSHHSKKTKNKESFTPILEQHPEGPDWIPYEDWILLKCITTVLEFPLSLTISVPAQIPNWSIVSDLTSAISKVKRSPLQCREHLMNTVIPREGPVVKGEDSGDLKRHRSKDGSLKKSKGRREQRTKGLVMADGGRDLTDQYSTSFNWLLSTASKRNQQSKFAWESLQKHSMHSELLKEYGIMVDVVHSPASIAQLRAERIQSVAAARAYQTATSGYTKATTPGLATPTDLTKLGGAFGLPGNRVVSSTGVLPPRVPLPLPTSLSSSSALANPVPLSTVVSSLPTTTLPVSNPSLPSSTHITHPLTSSLPTSTIQATSAVKAAYGPDLVGKIVPLQRHLSQQHAQFLLLRQNALQQQQVGGGANSQLTTAGLGGIPRLQTPPQSVLGTQKVGLPAGIEQLRPSVPSLPLQQRFTAAVTSAANAMRNITSRSLQTEEVLALLKQQSLRMAACQTYRAAHPTTQQQRESAVSAQLQAQLARPELVKSAIVLTSESASSFSSHAEQGKAGKLLAQPTARVVQVPITTAVSIPATPSSSVPTPSSSSQQSSVATPTATPTSSTPQAPPTSTASTNATDTGTS